MSGYTTENVKTLDSIDHIRLRPGVYLGGEARTTAAREVFDNAADEVRRGHGTTVALTLHEDGSIEVADDGRGLPVDSNADGINGIVLTVGTPMSGTNFDNEGTAAGTNGIGASATNAISERFDVTSFRDGKAYTQSFHRGRPGHFAGTDYDPAAAFTRKDGEKLVGRKSDLGIEHGTIIRFTFDPTMAADAEVDTADLLFRAGLTARLTEGLRLITRTPEGDSEFTGPYGVSEALTFGGGPAALAEVSGEYTFRRNERDVPVEYAVAFAPTTEPVVVSAVNGVYTPDGGGHVTGTLRALGAALSERRVRGLGLMKGEEYPSANDFIATAALSVSLRTPAPDFVGQDKKRLNAKYPALGNGIEREVARQVGLWAAAPANAEAVTAWAQMALEHARTVRKVESARASARAQRKAGSLGENLALPEKLVPCKETGRGSGAEIYLCEGDSALGTVKAARDSTYQAAYPLRGKPINVYGRALGSVGSPQRGTLRANDEFAAIEAILGCGVRDNCDPEKARYDRIIFAADADTDGAHINSLLINMFYDCYRPLIQAGMVYIAMPPLFIVTHGRGDERLYCLDESERDATVAELKKKGRTGIEVQRCKGLGEMGAKDFRATVMAPTRSLIRVTDDAQTTEMLELLFSTRSAAAEGRRDWIDQMREAGQVAVSDLAD